MKIRVKGAKKKNFDAKDLAELHEQITLDLNALETVILSLNGKDPIPSIGNFSDIGMVNGDLLRVLAVECQPTQITIDDIFKKYSLSIVKTEGNKIELGYRSGSIIAIFFEII